MLVDPAQHQCPIPVLRGEGRSGKPIEDLWQYIVLANEAHINSSSTVQGNISCEEGTRTDPESIQEKGGKTGNNYTWRHGLIGARISALSGSNPALGGLARSRGRGEVNRQHSEPSVSF